MGATTAKLTTPTSSTIPKKSTPLRPLSPSQCQHGSPTTTSPHQRCGSIRRPKSLVDRLTHTADPHGDLQAH